MYAAALPNSISSVSLIFRKRVCNSSKLIGSLFLGPSMDCIPHKKWHWVITPSISTKTSSSNLMARCLDGHKRTAAVVACEPRNFTLYIVRLTFPNLLRGIEPSVRDVQNFAILIFGRMLRGPCGHVGRGGSIIGVNTAVGSRMITTVPFVYLSA
jgi:hypothetical protein